MATSAGQSPATHGECKYFILLVDDCSCYMCLQLLTSKGEAAEAIKRFKARAEAESGKKLRMLRMDCGGEFSLVEFTAYCADQGVVCHHTMSYTPQQNGVVGQPN
jgi:hypothetical protein